MLDLVKPIERCYPVTFCIGGIVEHLVDKIINPGTMRHRHLSNMDNLGCVATNNMDTQNFQSIRMKKEFKHSRVISSNSIFRNFVII